MRASALLVAALLLVACSVGTQEEWDEMQARPNITERIGGPGDPIFRTFTVEPTPGVQLACVYAYSALWCARYYQDGEDW